MACDTNEYQLHYQHAIYKYRARSLYKTPIVDMRDGLHDPITIDPSCKERQLVWGVYYLSIAPVGRLVLKHVS